MRSLILLITLFISLPVFSCSEDGSGGIMEENKMNIPVDSFRTSGISEEQFNLVISKIETIYAPIISSLGGSLRIARKWEDGTVNANATRMGLTWHVNMYGGLARHEAITEDGFALVLCHELGHHIGGAPKVLNFISKWASNEGQADYFSSLKCLRKVFLNDDNESIVQSTKAPAILVDACKKNHKNKDDQFICIRTGLAGQSVSNLFAAMRNQPEAKFETPDLTIVAMTNDRHPNYQCRLDTYFQGALCGANFNEDVSQKDEVQGTCHQELGHQLGLRPKCWFKAKK
jgi:hypothetical protein